VSRDQKLDAAMASCTRFLNGHGPRRVNDLLATIPTDSAIDYYGVGGVVTALEDRVATLLGKPAALFLPSGTMAQQIVLRVHGERRGAKSVAFHPFCHLDSHEERGYQQLHDLFAIPVGPRNEPLSTANLSLVHEPVGTLLIELPQRDLGGVLPSWRELNAQISWARDRGAATHLDGARLWESTPFYRKSPAQIAALFDTVYVSFYKGLGGITGCCVAGERDVIDEVSVWRTRHGGRLFGMWPYAASALTVLDQRLPLMGRYYRHSVAIGAALKDVPGVEVIPTKIQAPMMHLRLNVTLDDLRSRALDIAQTDKVWTFARAFTSEDERRQRIEFTVGDATLEFSPDEIRHYLRQLVKKPSARASSR
jgi:threonine aldolase